MVKYIKNFNNLLIILKVVKITAIKKFNICDGKLKNKKFNIWDGKLTKKVGKFRTDAFKTQWMDGWVGGWVGGLKAVLRIAYSNQQRPPTL